MRVNWTRRVRVLLPDKQNMVCTVRVGARGWEVMRAVQREIGVGDLRMFGLALLWDSEYLFLDLKQKLSKYFQKEWNKRSLAAEFILFLRVQFYVESGLLILSSKEQQLYYTEVRQKVLQSQSRQQEALFFQLAASALQAELGDQETGDEPYFSPEGYFPSWLIAQRGRDFLLQHASKLHGDLRGEARSRAALRFIREASCLQDGSLVFYGMKQEKKEQRYSILLGVALTGICIHQEKDGTHYPLFEFSWTDVDYFTFQNKRFEIAPMGFLRVPKLVFYAPSLFHSKHILKHICDSHRLHISIRDAASCAQQLENMQACHKEVSICDTTRLRQRLRSYINSSVSDCRGNDETSAVRTRQKDGGDNFLADAELWVRESEEAFVDNPAEVSWLAELIYGASVDGPLELPSNYWTAVTMEMKQVLWRRAANGVSVD